MMSKDGDCNGAQYTADVKLLNIYIYQVMMVASGNKITWSKVFLPVDQTEKRAEKLKIDSSWCENGSESKGLTKLTTILEVNVPFGTHFHQLYHRNHSWNMNCTIMCE